MPKRVQMSRQHPWRAENPDAVIVDRRTPWGNGFRVVPVHARGPFDVMAGDTFFGQHTGLESALRQTVDLFRLTHIRGINLPDADEIRAELAGKDLACWCPLDQPCHADVLLEIANSVPAPTHKLDVYGLKDDREEAIEALAAVVAVPTQIVHHPRPWSDNVITAITEVPVVPITRGQRWANLAFIAACAFVIGVVVWNAAVRP